MKMSSSPTTAAAEHTFRAVIHPGDAATADRPGRVERTAIRER